MNVLRILGRLGLDDPRRPAEGGHELPRVVGTDHAP